MDGLNVALVFALTSVPSFLIARSLERSAAAATAPGPNRPLARLMRFVGAILLGGAVAMLWAGGDPTRVLAVALAMALAVNGLAVLMFVTVARHRRRQDRE